MRTHQDRMTGRRRPLYSFGARRGHPRRRMRMLQRLGQNLDVVERKVFSAISKPLVAPRCQHDLNRLTKTKLALVLRHAKSSELARIESTTRAPIHPAAGQDIQ